MCIRDRIEDAKKQQKNGLVTVVGTKKNHFMSDTKWLLQHGFKEIEKLPNGFSLLVMSFHENSAVPVSYTHLDVYKRQDQVLLNGSQFAQSLCKRVGKEACKLIGV